jgi:hypothetical protein
MPELLFEARNPLVLERSEVPLWLRGNPTGEVALRSLVTISRMLFEISIRLVHPVRRRLSRGERGMAVLKGCSDA